MAAIDNERSHVLNQVFCWVISMKIKKKLLCLLAIVFVIIAVYYAARITKALVTIKKQIEEIYLKDKEAQGFDFVDPNV